MTLCSGPVSPEIQSWCGLVWSVVPTQTRLSTKAMTWWALLLSLVTRRSYGCCLMREPAPMYDDGTETPHCFGQYDQAVSTWPSFCWRPAHLLRPRPITHTVVFTLLPKK